jgi:simple sugar transport system permease protein
LLFAYGASVDEVAWAEARRSVGIFRQPNHLRRSATTMSEAQNDQPAATSASAGRYTQMTFWTRLRRHPTTNVAVLYTLLFGTCLIVSLLFPASLHFLEAGNLNVLAQQVPVIAILAVGAGMLMIAGEFDLSVAGVYTLAPYLMAMALNKWGLPLLPALALAILVGLAVGLINGLVTIRLGVPSFIATLGMMFFLRGIVRFVSISSVTGQPDQISLNPGETFANLVSGRILGGIQAQLFWLAVFALLAGLILNRHVLGNHIFAAGGDREAARKSGIAVDRVKVVTFMICSVYAVIAGVIQATRINTITPAQTLTGLELQAIASAVIGGVYLFGGRGTVLGMVLGAALIVTVENVLILMRFPGEYMPAFIGALVILSVIINTSFGSRISRPRGSL